MMKMFFKSSREKNKQTKTEFVEELQKGKREKLSLKNAQSNIKKTTHSNNTEKKPTPIKMMMRQFICRIKYS